VATVPSRIGRGGGARHEEEEGSLALLGMTKRKAGAISRTDLGTPFS